MRQNFTTNDLRLRVEELSTNPSMRVPVILCIDTSYSMKNNDRLINMQKGIEKFVRDMSKDDIACDSVELCVVTFGGRRASLQSDFTLVSSFKMDKMQADLGTHLCDGIELSLQCLDNRLIEYESFGVDYYRPYLIIIGDAGISDPKRRVQEIAKALQERQEDKRLSLLLINVNENPEEASNGQFIPNQRVYRLDHLKFKEFFAWFSKTIEKVSQSFAGQEDELNLTNGLDEFMK